MQKRDTENYYKEIKSLNAILIGQKINWSRVDEG